MKFSRRHEGCLAAGVFVLLIHALTAAFLPNSFALTMIGDAVPVILLLLAVLSARENFAAAPRGLLLFWKLFAGALGLIGLSQLYWFYYDWPGHTAIASPVLGDSLFLMANSFLLSALALRPHSSSAGRDLPTRGLDFLLVILWWFSLYAYFSLPWQVVLHDLSRYTPAFYLLQMIQHLVILGSLGVLALRSKAAWRSFYQLLSAAFLLIAVAAALQYFALKSGSYYSGGFYDTPYLAGLCLLILVPAFGKRLQPLEDASPHRELAQRVWTARIAMLGFLSLPIIAGLGLLQGDIPEALAVFRLRLVFGAMFLLGALVYAKFNLLTSELMQLVRLTHDSIENLNAVQQQVTHSEKLIALGRLAAGAAHEISNPLTAILGYSELLSDIPSLTEEDHGNAKLIQQQVHRAQTAVNSLRQVVRPSSAQGLIDKKPVC